MPEYRVNYTIERREDGGEFVEIGFGASGATGSIDSASYDVESQIRNQEWETSEGMPDPANA